MVETYMKIYALGAAVVFVLGLVVSGIKEALDHDVEEDDVEFWMLSVIFWPAVLYIGLWFAAGIIAAQIWDWYTARKWLKERENPNE